MNTYSAFKRYFVLLLLVVFSVLGVSDISGEVVCGGEKKSEAYRPAFYANRAGVQFGTPEIEAAILKHLGYAGISQDWVMGEALAKRVKAFEAAGLKVLSLYVIVDDMPLTKEQLLPLKNRGAHIEMAVKKITPKTLDSIRKTADVAQSLGIRVTIYPHNGYDVMTTLDGIKYVKKINHPNVGLMFTLCHFLIHEDVKDLDSLIEHNGEVAWLSVKGGGVGGHWGDVRGRMNRLIPGPTSPERRSSGDAPPLSVRAPFALMTHRRWRSAGASSPPPALACAFPRGAG